MDLTMALDSLVKTAPAIALQGQLHSTPASLSSDLKQFISSFYPSSILDSSDSTSLQQDATTLPHPASVQKVLNTIDSTTPYIIHEPETATQELQEQPKPTTPEQRVAPQHINSNAPMDNTLHAMVNDKAAITPARTAGVPNGTKYPARITIDRTQHTISEDVHCSASDTQQNFSKCGSNHVIP